MTQRVNQLVYLFLMLLVALAPLPLGSNREWSWALCAFVAGVLAAVWLLTNLRSPATLNARLPRYSPVACLLVCAWIILQRADWTPTAWHHPLWGMAAEALSLDLHGRVTLSTEDSGIALMRLLAYALVFFLAMQLGRERKRAQAIFGWLTVAGLVYAIFGLFVYWSGYHPTWLFGEKLLPHDVRATFINRNHYATWQGLTMICAMAWFYHSMARPEVKPYSVPQDREAQVEAFIIRAWKPLIVLLLMVTARVLSHSRGGFASALLGTFVLFYLLDRSGFRKRTGRRVAATAVLVVAAVAFFLTSEALLDRINRTDISTEERLAVYTNINQAVQDNPVLGFGYGTFANSYRLYDPLESGVHYDRAHNTWLENVFELGLPAALALFLALGGLALTCLQGVRRRHRDWVYPATGVAASTLVGIHALVDFSLQIPAVALLYAVIMGVAVAQSNSSVNT